MNEQNMIQMAPETSIEGDYNYLVGLPLIRKEVHVRGLLVE